MSKSTASKDVLDPVAAFGYASMGVRVMGFFRDDYLAVASDGSVFIAHDQNSSGHIVTKLDADGAFAWGYSSGGNPNAAYFVAGAPDGSCRFSNGVGVYSISSSGSLQWFALSGLSVSQGNAVPIKVDSQGNTAVGAFRRSAALVSETRRFALISPAGAHLGYGADHGYTLATGGHDLIAKGNVFYLVSGVYSSTFGPGTGMPGWTTNSSPPGIHSFPSYPDGTVSKRAAWSVGTGSSILVFAGLGFVGIASGFANGWDGTTGWYGCAGVGTEASGKPIHSAVENANDQHDGTVPGQLKNVFKTTPNGQLLASARVGTGDLNHMIVSII